MTKGDVNAKVMKSDDAWREQLTPQQYAVARGHGTERAFTGPWWDNKAGGTYSCVCCGEPLFDSATKFDSGTGWPSFFAPLTPGSVEEHVDGSMFMRRTEVRCARCDAHLGHVFSRRAPADRPALLHERHGARFRAEGLALRYGNERPRDAAMMVGDDDVLQAAQDWRQSGRAVAIATVVETWGSAPRPIGSHLVVDGDGLFLGSVSGGCVEADVVSEAIDVIATGMPRLLDFGVADSLAWKAGLSCGGRIKVLVERLD